MPTTYPDPLLSLARQLAHAYQNQQVLNPSQLPSITSRTEAYQVQQTMLAMAQEPIGAWKVGVCETDDGVWGSPLPVSALSHDRPRQFRAGAPLGLEVELAFRLNDAALDPDYPLSEAEFLKEGIHEMALAVEVVSSRLLGWPQLPDFLKLADWQNHGALFLGVAQPYTADFPYLSPQVQLWIAGENRAKVPATNPAGDPRHLIPAFIRQCHRHHRPIQSDQWITTGSYSGVYFLDKPAAFTATMTGVPDLSGEIIV